jgi:phage shock protein PspC (stress-responsive transcriptional regulator)
MNRTTDINLGGMVFHIDENAYPVLNNYLQTLKKHFATQASGDEVMTDIEIRIAEMFQKHTNITKQNITIIDVEEVMQTMGSPENFTEDEATANPNATQQHSAENPTTPTPKRIYRDTDKRILGGVCAGASNYLGYDPLFMRLAFVIAFFTFGAGFLVYLILWIIIPEARTSAEKLQMYGEPVTISNIEKTIKNEFNKVNDNLASTNFTGQLTEATRGISDNVIRILTTLFKIAGTIIAVIAAFIGVVLLLILLQFLFGSDAIMNITENGTQYWPNVFRLSNFFDTEAHAYLAEAALLLVLGVPLITMIYNGVRVLLGVARNKYFTRTASVLWIVGIVLCIISFNRINRVFATKSTLKNSIALNASKNKTIVLKAITTIEGEDDEDKKLNIVFGSVLFNNTNEGSLNKQGVPSLKILKSTTDSAYIIITKQANASTKKIAAGFANQINYNLQLTDSVVTIDNLFDVTNLTKWRNQKLSVKVYLPIGQKIFIDATVANLLDDIDNVSNTYDGDMVNHTWQMQTQGLVCLDKLNNDDVDTDDDDSDTTKDINMSVNKNGVYINGKRVDDESNNNSNEKNININAQEVNLKIDGNGVSAQVKGKKKTE